MLLFPSSFPHSPPHTRVGKSWDQQDEQHQRPQHLRYYNYSRVQLPTATTLQGDAVLHPDFKKKKETKTVEVRKFFSS